MDQNPPVGTISWVDLSTPDLEGARAFYSGLLGWDLTVQNTSMGEYVVAGVSGRETAGMMAQQEAGSGTPANWTVFILVDDLGATLARVTEAGGAVLQQPFEIPGGAQVAVVADTSGAMVALITGGPEPGPYYSQKVGAVCWAELMTRDPDAAASFYGSVLGWEANRDSGNPDYTVFQLGEEMVAGLIRTPDHLPPEVPDAWSVYFTVEDCTDAENRAVALGGSVVLASTPTPMGPFAVLADPAGAMFQIMEMTT